MKALVLKVDVSRHWLPPSPPSILSSPLFDTSLRAATLEYAAGMAVKIAPTSPLT
jgi:hypothetical protein